MCDFFFQHSKLEFSVCRFNIMQWLHSKHSWNFSNFVVCSCQSIREQMRGKKTVENFYRLRKKKRDPIKYRKFWVEKFLPNQSDNFAQKIYKSQNFMRSFFEILIKRLLIINQELAPNNHEYLQLKFLL